MNRISIYTIVIISFLAGCSNNETITVKSKSYSPESSITCNGTKIFVDKSNFKTNKEKTKLYLPVSFNNQLNKTRNDIVYGRIGFFHGHSDNGLSLNYTPSFIRLLPFQNNKQELTFILQKNTFPNIFTKDTLNNLSSIQISMSFKCKTNTGITQEIYKRY